MSTTVSAKMLRLLNAMSSFAGRLKEAMNDAEKSAAQLAREIGMTRANVTHWLGRAQAPSANLAAKAAQVLNVSPQWLATGIGPKRLLSGQPYPAQTNALTKGALLTVKEHAMDFEKGASLLVEAWKKLPENERDEVLQQVNVRSMKYRTHKRDEQLSDLAAPGTETAKRRKVGTQ